MAVDLFEFDPLFLIAPPASTSNRHNWTDSATEENSEVHPGAVVGGAERIGLDRA
ncbi:MAG: hypothetical protein R2710_25515 [Acidimicrobiales bacterium]